MPRHPSKCAISSKRADRVTSAHLLLGFYPTVLIIQYYSYISSFKSIENIQKEEGVPGISVKSKLSLVILNELALEARRYTE